MQPQMTTINESIERVFFFEGEGGGREFGCRIVSQEEGRDKVSKLLTF